MDYKKLLHYLNTLYNEAHRCQLDAVQRANKTPDDRDIADEYEYWKIRCDVLASVRDFVTREMYLDK